MLNEFINFLIPILIAGIMIIIMIKLVMGFVQYMPKPKKVDIEPTTVGDRLKKYLVKAGQINPRTAKILKLRRTKFNEGGKIGYITGVIQTRTYTRFIFKPKILGFKKILYCPTSLHSPLHYKEIILNAVAIENAGGFYYPIPYDTNLTNAEVFNIAQKAFQADLKKMEIMDLYQLEIEQVYGGLAGVEKEEEITHKAPEEIEYVEQDEEEKVYAG